MTTITSGASARISSIAFGSLILAGCKIDTLWPTRAALIGGAVIFWSRPTGLSGCVTTPINSCSDFWSGRKVGTPISPVPMNTIRICGLSKGSKWNANLSPWLHRLGHHFLAGGNFALANRRAALTAEVIEDLFVRQN